MRFYELVATRKDGAAGWKRGFYFAMLVRAHWLEQNACERLREEIVTASREETNAPQV